MSCLSNCKSLSVSDLDVERIITLLRVHVSEIRINIDGMLLSSDWGKLIFLFSIRTASCANKKQKRRNLIVSPDAPRCSQRSMRPSLNNLSWSARLPSSYVLLADLFSGQFLHWGFRFAHIWFLNRRNLFSHEESFLFTLKYLSVNSLADPTIRSMDLPEETNIFRNRKNVSICFKAFLISPALRWRWITHYQA